MTIFFCGIAYGIFVTAAFLFLMLTIVASYIAIHGDAHHPLDDDDALDAILWALRHLGPARVCLYVILALLWPLVLIVSTIALSFLSRYEREEDVPPHLLYTVEWTLLGMGKFVHPLVVVEE